MSKYLIIILLIVGCSREKKIITNNISIVDFSSHARSEDGFEGFDINNEVRIAFYKDYILYRTSLTSTVDTNRNNEAHIYLNEPVGKKVHSYFVIKNGDQKGIVYGSTIRNRIIDVNIFLRDHGLNFDGSSFFKMQLNREPDTIIRDLKSKEIVMDKYAVKNKQHGQPDFVYRYYNKDLSGLQCSFNKPLDKKMNSKMWKISLIFVKSHNSGAKDALRSQNEAYWKFDKTSLSKSEIKELMGIFNIFIKERSKIDLRN